jgi:uncharacterized protein (TIGR02466 family)
MESTVNFLFPLPVIRVEGIEADFDDLESICYALRDTSPGRKVSNMLGWQSEGDVLSNDAAAPIADVLSRGIAEALSSGIFNDVSAIINDAWINISGRYAYNTTHIHPRADFSGVFYIKCDPSSSGNIVFSARDARLDTEFYRPEAKDQYKLYPTWWYQPLRGTLLLFPSELYHRVDQNLSDSERISVAFNLIFRKETN